MAKVQFLSITEQVTQHLRKEIIRGHYGNSIPGVRILAHDLGIDMKTANNALKALENEGLLITQGAGKQRRINSGKHNAKMKLRIHIMLYEKNDLNIGYHIEIRHRLEDAGHFVTVASKTLEDLGMNVDKVASYVRTCAADAWIVVAASREVFEWFSSQPVPSFALFGNFFTLPMAGMGPNKSPCLSLVLRELIDLGHRRIVMLSREALRKPVPAIMEQRFLDTLQSLGVPVGNYNLPDWTETPKGFQEMLDSLFRHTPPTTLIIDGSNLFFAVQSFLSQRGLSSPRDVSLISLDPDPIYDWTVPVISHIAWDSGPFVRRVVNWARNVAQGKEDHRQSYPVSEFVRGGTIGPAPESKVIP